MFSSKYMLLAGVAALSLSAATFANCSPASADDAAPAAEEDVIPGKIAATVGVGSDYLFRGISQTDHNPAIQGSLEYNIDIETGLPHYLTTVTPYVNVWGSNVDFNDQDTATLELDLGFGFRGTVDEIGNGLAWDIGGVYYYYPGAENSNVTGQASNYDYWEIPLKVSYPFTDWLTAGVGYNYSPDFFAGSGEAHYVNGNATITLPKVSEYFDWSLNSTVGYQWIDDDAAFGAPSYLVYSVGGAVTVKGVNFGVSWTDTNLSKSDCFNGTNLCDGRVMFNVGYTF